MRFTLLLSDNKIPFYRNRGHNWAKSHATGFA